MTMNTERLKEAEILSELAKDADRSKWVENVKTEPFEIIDDRPAIRKALKESRNNHTKRVRSILP